MKKRILAMLLAITMMIGMVPVQVFATETEPVEAAEEVVVVTEEVAAAAEEAMEAAEKSEAETTLPEEFEEETTVPEESEEETTVPEETEVLPPSGNAIGSIRVIVENTTFTTDEGAAWDGTLLDTEVALLDDMTMMTAILSALNNAGHTWEGTGGQTENGWDITYISSINKNGTAALAEFHGGNESGWMGTLNDWFVNKGFEQWKAGKDLLDGDVIHVMYTQNGYGADIGGAPNVNVGYLNSLSASAGTLDTAFDKDALEYTLTVPYGTGSVDISAAAENKQDKVTVQVGETEYRRGEKVAVADGTVISVACGDKTYTVTVTVAACEHQWSDATCTAPKTCSVCGATEGEANGHSWVDATCIAPKTCSACGETEGEADADAHSCGEDGICTLCGADTNAAVPFSQQITIPSNGNSSWGYVSKLVLSGTDGGIYEAYWSSETSPNFVVDVILTQDTALDATITAAFSVGGMQAPSIKGDTTVTLVDGKGTISVTAERGVSFYDTTYWTINLTVDDGSAANRASYSVTLPDGGEAYTAAAYGSSVSPVIEGRKYSFTVTIPNTYTKEDNFAVKANGVELTASNNVYTIENITEDQVVTVEGVRAKTLAELNVTIIVPEGSIVSTGKFYSYFKYDFDEPLETTTLEDGSIQLIVPVPGSQNFLRVQHPDGVTYWDFDGMSAGSVFEITKEMLHIGDTEFTKDTVYANFEQNAYDKADLYLTVNEKGWLDMATGDTWNLNVFRNFLSLGDTISNNCLALPDTHYKVIAPDGSDSDVVTVTPDANNSCYAEIKAEKAGTAIILVTYDAVTNNDGAGGKQWSAIWPENTGVIVVTVDAETADITTNMTVNEEANAGKKQVIDAEHDILFYVGNVGASYSFQPEEGCTVTVNRSTVGSAMTFGGFSARGVSYAADGTVTVTGLTTGTHIIKVTKDGKSVYQVVRARQVSYELLHSDGTEVTSGNPAEAGETITVQFHNLVSPMEKLSGVYNANFGFWYNGEDGTEIRKAGGTYGVYTFSSSTSLQQFTVTIPSGWKDTSYTLTDGAIKLGGFGSSCGAHRTTTYIAGKEVNTNASGIAGVLAVLPDISINTIPCEYEIYDVSLPTGEGYTVSGDSETVIEGDTYSFTVNVNVDYDGTDMVVKVNDEVVTATDGVYAVEDVREDLVITVEGVAKLAQVDMSEATAVYTQGVDSGNTKEYWGYSRYGNVSTVSVGGADVVSYTWDEALETCNVTLSYETPVNGIVGFEIVFGGTIGSYKSKMQATLNGTAMTNEEAMSVRLNNGSFEAVIHAWCENRGEGTKTFIITVEDIPEDILQEVLEAVASVEELIDAIELPVDLGDGDTIKAAWEAYEALPEYQQQLVSNRDILEDAKAELDAIKAENTKNPVTITVTIANAGQLVLAQQSVTVYDINDNGWFDVDDALYIAHEAAYPGGAEAGYGSAYSQYGLGITKLWGDTSGSFGYWLSDNSCWSLEDTVSEGDSLFAFVYQDQTYWSDAYAKFDAASYEVDEDVPLTVSVEKAGYDESYNTVWSAYVPVLTVVDGDLNPVDASVYTQNGSTVTIFEPGEYYLVASGVGTDILVPAAAKVKVLDRAEAKLISGKSVTLKASASGKVTWSLVSEYAPYASITSSGKLTAKKVVEKVIVYAVATDAQGNEEYFRVDIYPAASQVKILDEAGNLVTSKTVAIKVNDGSDETYVFSAGTYPDDAMGDVTWTVSDKKGAYVTYEIDGSDIILQPAAGVKKGTVTLTATANDGSNKKATLKLSIAVLVEDIAVTTKDGKNLTQDDAGNTIFTVASGQSITLTAAPTNANATNKAVTWSIVEGGEYASITSAGKLTAVKDLMGVRYAVVRATAKDGSGIYTDTKVKLTPLALGVQMYNSGSVCGNTALTQNMTEQNTLTLNARVYPLGKANQSVTWKSSNAKIASIQLDENGYAIVTCLKAGKVTITATADDGSKEKTTFTLNIVEGIESLHLAPQVIAAGKTLKLADKIEINPTTATNKKLNWGIVGDAHGATIDSKKGVLNTKKVDVSSGPVKLTISASPTDGFGATPAVCTVTVYPATTKAGLCIKNGETVVASKDVLELVAGEELTLTGYCEGAANVYTWKSNNKNVTVNNGVVTASEAAIGKTVTITCTADDGTGVKVTAKVKIVAPEAEE